MLKIAYTLLLVYGLTGCSTLRWKEYRQTSAHCDVAYNYNILIKCPDYVVRCGKYGRNAKQFCVREKL